MTEIQEALNFQQTLCLSAQTERFDDGAVAFDVAVVEIVQKRASFTYHLRQRTSSVMIFTVLFQVFRQMGNTV